MEPECQMLYLQGPVTRPCSEPEESSLRSKNLPSKFHAHLRLGTLFSLLLNGMWDAFIICRMTRLSLNHYSY